MAKNSTKSKASTATQLRQDIYVYNEANAFLFTSPVTRSKQFSDEQWIEAVKKGEMIPISLYQDDAFFVRVVLNGELNAQEKSEWLGKTTHKLKISNGKLIIAAGFEYILEIIGDDEEWIDEYIRPLAVPDGEYRADVYTYINSVNGEPLLALADGTKAEPVGKYFRRTRKGTKFPTWLQQWCTSYPDKDPKHEEEWQDADYDDTEVPYVCFLLHLTPLEDNIPLTKGELEEGCYGIEHCEVRKPDKCPLGIECENVIGKPEPKEYVAPPVQGIDVLAMLSGKPLAKLDTAVEIPLSELSATYTVIRYCNASAQPELRLSGADADAIISQIPSISKAEVITDNGTKSIRVPAQAGPFTTREMMDELAQSKFDTVHLELCCADLDGDPQGCVRFSGPLSSKGWKIESVYPPSINHDVLKQALIFAGNAIKGDVRAVRDEDKLAFACAVFDAEFGIIFRNNLPAVKDGKVTFAQPDTRGLDLVAQSYFRLAFLNDFPLYPIDPSLLEKAERIKKASATTQDVLFEGNGRTYTTANISSLDKKSVADCQNTDKQIAELGGKVIGDLACSAFPGFVFRYYTLPDGHSRLCWFARENFGPMKQIVCEFKDDAILYSTSGPSKLDEPKKKLFRLQHTTESLAELYAEHRKRCEELTKKHKGLKPFEATMAECAKRFEEGLIRQE